MRAERSESLSHQWAVVTVLEWIEGALGTLWLVCFPVMVIGWVPIAVLILWDESGAVNRTYRFHFTRDHALWATVLLVPMLIAQILTLRFINRRLNQFELTDMPTLAVAQPVFAWLVRVPIGLWWLTQFGGSLALGYGLVQIYRQNVEAHAMSEWLMRLLAVLVPMAAANAGNCFLLLAAFSLTRSARLVKLLWWLRWPIDLGIVLVTDYLARA
jgi:hypothetical protein